MMPGARRVSMYAVPSPSGSCAICWLLTVVPLIPVVVLSNGVSAMTTMVSAMVPVSIAMSTRTMSPTCTS